MTTEIQTTSYFVQHHLESYFTKFQLEKKKKKKKQYLAITRVPIYHEFYYRNYRALNTTFNEISAENEITSETQHIMR